MTKKIELSEFEMTRFEAQEKWREYTKACKDNPGDEFLQDMKALYNQLKCGRKVIDINKVMKRGGTFDTGEPRLAILRADYDVVYLNYDKDGTVTMKIWNDWGFRKTIDFRFRDIFPALDDELCDFRKNWEGKTFRKDYIHRKTIAPKIPASLRPKGRLSNYWILWEVEEWKPVPPIDPYLLRRLTPNMFVVVAGWNLTELERAAIAGRIS